MATSCDLNAPRCTTTVPQVRLHGSRGGVLVGHRPPRDPGDPLQDKQFYIYSDGTHTHTNTHTNTHTHTPKHTHTQTPTHTPPHTHTHTHPHTHTHTHTHPNTHTHKPPVVRGTRSPSNEGAPGRSRLLVRWHILRALLLACSCACGALCCCAALVVESLQIP